MRYPVFMTRINQILGRISGCLIIVIGILSVIEAIMRTFFIMPTSWSLDLCTYLLIWAIFLGSPYSYQEKGHVAVDLLRDLVEKMGGKLPRRIMSLVGYVIVLIVLAVVFYGSIILSRTALRLNKLTMANFQIPAIYLYAAIVIGTIAMLATAVFIVLDLVAGGDKYL